MLIRLVALSSVALVASACAAQVRVVVDHVGYDVTAPKRALVVVDGVRRYGTQKLFSSRRGHGKVPFDRTGGDGWRG